MDSLLTAALQLSLMMALGFLLARQGILKKEFNEGLTAFLLRWSLPALILVSMQKDFTPDRLWDAGTVVLVSLGYYLLSLAVGEVWIRLAKPPVQDRGIHRFVLLFSNVGFMGFPVLEALWGREVLFWGAIFNIPFHFLVFSLGIRLLMVKPKAAGESFVATVLLNPGIVATVAGFLLFLFSWKFPKPLYDTLNVLGGLTTPLSMVLIGSQLARTSVRQTLKSPGLWGLAALRLLVIPLGLLGVLTLFPLSREIVQVGVIIAAMPAAANLVLLASAYSDRPQVAGQGVFITTLGSLVTLPLVILIMNMAW